MSWYDKLFTKRAQSTTSLAIINPTAAQHSPRDYRTFSEEGYKKNVISYRCIERITDAMSAVELCLYKKSAGKQKAKEIESHPIIDLLAKPNPSQSYQSFMKSAFGYFLINGNNYIQAVGTTDEMSSAPPKELWNLRPDRMKITPGKYMFPLNFIEEVNNNKKIFPVDQITGDSAIMHLKAFNPIDDWYGMSPIEAAAFSVDQYNSMGKWNLSLLQNSGRPSGALLVKQTAESPDGSLSEEQRTHLKREMEAQYQGARNSGRPLLLEGGMEWIEMGFNPKDMDWIEGKHTTARDIAQAFGVPPQLLGIPGDNTYSNYEQAKLAFYVDTIIPLAKFWADHLNNWLVPAFDESLILEPDINAIEALEPMRAAKWTQISGATFLTTNEKREQLGYGKYEGADDPADQILVGMGLTPLDLLGTETPEDAGTDGEDYEKPSDEEPDSEDPEEDTEDPEEDPKSYNVYFEGKSLNLRSRASKERYRRMVISKRTAMGKSFQAQIKAIWKKESTLVASAVKDISPQLIDYAVGQALEKTKPLMKEVFKRHILDVMKSFGQDILDLSKSFEDMETKAKAKDSGTRYESFLNNYIDNYVGSRITGIQGTTKKRVVRSLRKGFAESAQDGETAADMVKMVKETYAGFEAPRAATIVRTEMGIAQNEAHRAAAKALNIPGLQKIWISDQRDTARDFNNGDATDHTVMMDVSVGVNEKFHVPTLTGTDEMDGPCDPDAPADQVINCLCVSAFSVQRGSVDNE